MPLLDKAVIVLTHHSSLWIWNCHWQLCGKAASGIAVWMSWRLACLIVRIHQNRTQMSSCCSATADLTGSHYATQRLKFLEKF